MRLEGKKKKKNLNRLQETQLLQWLRRFYKRSKTKAARMTDENLKSNKPVNKRPTRQSALEQRSRQ